MAAALSEDDLKKMEEAKKQMAKIDDSFANFEAGAIEMVIEVKELRVNARPPPESAPPDDVANQTGNDRG